MPEELVVGGRPLRLTRWHGRVVTTSTAWWARRPAELRQAGYGLEGLACVHGERLSGPCAACD